MNKSEIARALAAMRKNPGRKPEPCSDPVLAEKRKKLASYMREYRAKKKQEVKTSTAS